MTDKKPESNGRVTLSKLYEELTPIRDDISTLRVEMRWVKWLIGAALASNLVTLFGGPTPPTQAAALVHLIF